MCQGRTLEVTLSLHGAECPPGPRRLKGLGDLRQGRVFHSLSQCCRTDIKDLFVTQVGSQSGDGCLPRVKHRQKPHSAAP